jgi:hypothetical protein
VTPPSDNDLDTCQKCGEFAVPQRQSDGRLSQGTCAACVSAGIGQLAGQAVDSNGSHPPASRPLDRFDLGAVMRTGVPEPELLVGGLLYRGAVHIINGQPEAGKTTVIAWWIRELFDAGLPVMYLDEESGVELMAEKLLAVGVTPDQVDKLLHYFPFPGRTWDDADLNALHEQLDHVRPALLVGDSMSAMLASADKDENVARDVRRFAQKVLVEPARQYGHAALITDHLAKRNDPKDPHGRGSGDKLAAVDVTYRLESVSSFDRARSGVVRLICRKDRRGYIGRDKTWNIAVRTGDGRIELVTTAVDLPGATTSLDAGLNDGEREILQALRQLDRPATVAEVAAQVGASTGREPSRPHVSGYLNDLSRAGFTRVAEKGARGLKLWTAINP